jgi:hypothetical protein
MLSYIHFFLEDKLKEQFRAEVFYHGNMSTIAHSGIYASSSNSWNTSGFCLFMETFCFP